MLVKKVYTVSVVLLICLCSTGFSIQPVSGTTHDLILSSSIGFDRSPTILEWRQYSHDWKLFDFRVLRKSNETWTDVAIENRALFNRLVVSIDNNRGFSAVISRTLDQYCGFTGEAIFLPNEPWRHYQGVTVCDVDRDNNNDLIVISSTKTGQKELIVFRMNKAGKILQEKTIVKLSKDACGLGAIGNGKYSRFFVALAGMKQKSSRINEYRVSNNLKLVARKKNFLRVSSIMGQIGDIDVRWSKEKKYFEMVICTHSWPDKKQMPKESKAYQIDSNFILPAADISSIESRIYLAKFSLTNKLQKIKLVEKSRFRRWTGVAFLNPSRYTVKKTFQNKKQTGGAGVLHIAGLFEAYYGVEKIAHSVGIPCTTKYTKHYLGMWEIKALKFCNLYKFDVIFLTGVPLWALGAEGEQAIISFVKTGGTLVFCDDVFAGKAGGYCQSNIAEILPVEFHDGGIIKTSPESVSVDNNFFWRPPQKNLWYLRGRKLKDKMKRLAWVDKDVLVAENQTLKGKVIYFGVTALNEDGTKQIDLWNAIKFEERIFNIRGK